MTEVAVKMCFFGFLTFCVLPLVYTADMPLQMDIKNLNLELTVAGCDHFLYELKTCKDHRLYLYDARGSVIAHLLVGGWGGKACHIRIISTGKTLKTETPGVLACYEFRWFWVSWNNGSIVYGRGQSPGENVLIGTEDPSGRRVKRIQLRTGDIVSTAKIGHFVTGSFRYEKDITEGYMTTNQLQSIISVSLETCASECSRHAHCGLFSYDQGQGMCHLINRRAPWQHHTRKSGWQTWNMLFC